MQLQKQTRSLLNKLEDTEWFTAAGKPLPESMHHLAIRVSSWHEAIEDCSSIEWENFTLEQRNLLTMHLHVHAHDRYQKWNDIAIECNELLAVMLKKKLSTIAELLGTETNYKKIWKSIRCDIRGACMELEFSDIREPGFFCGLMEWYFAGRFPCGWGEPDVDGKTVLLGPVDEGEQNLNETDWTKIVLAEQDRVYRPKVRLPAKGKLLVY